MMAANFGQKVVISMKTTNMPVSILLNKRIKIQDGCQSFPKNAATKTARVTLTF